MLKVKKRYIIGALLVVFIIVSIATNPTKQDYINYTNFNEEEMEQAHEQLDFEIEKINFFIFSTYAIKESTLGHYGIVHLAFMGNFFQISDGQYDYPWWLEFFN
ncbi:hypothetical protein CEY16_06510 [Halalkalibacillus sediminis]|uniref:DUF4359 domain-containing protein n=1 Tax=Halalkalibacillus sediminis TaxID=2018042 RepID=A0A2I0QTD1_9BACI|nr:hypothetical protein [Halalkalibacillus sediminis]PKR77586.1 hypothetical protein CEY16_06510 [Halalkalibacillus sediminis]